MTTRTTVTLPLSLLLLATPLAADGEFLLGQRLDGGTAGGPATTSNDHFGSALAALGDLNGDGQPEIAVGAPDDVDPGVHNGAVHIVSLSSLGTSIQNVLIDGVAANPAAQHSSFGRSLAGIGDLNGDGTTDLAVGEDFDLWVLLLDKEGKVIGAVENESSALGFFDFNFASSLCAAGDVNGDGTPDLIAADPNWSVGGQGPSGGLWTLFLAPNGKVIGIQQVTEGVGLTGVNLDLGDGFGSALANVGDVDNDGRTEIAVGAPGDDNGNADAGAVYLLSLNSDGTMELMLKISDTSGHLDQALPAGTHFGSSLAAIGDFDSAAGPDLLVGSAEDGELWTLFLRINGLVRTSLHYGVGDLPATYSAFHDFGAAVLATDDLDGNGFVEFVVGAPKFNGGALESGSIFTLFPEGVTGASVADIGCTGNPAGSLFVDILPVLGEAAHVRLDIPFPDAMHVGSTAFLIADVDVLSCGFQVAGAGLESGALPGELYLLPPFNYISTVGFWEGPGGAPTLELLAIPSAPVYLGLEVGVQGLFYDPIGGPSGTNFYGLTEGKVLTIGS